MWSQFFKPDNNSETQCIGVNSTTRFLRVQSMLVCLCLNREFVYCSSAWILFSPGLFSCFPGALAWNDSSVTLRWMWVNLPTKGSANILPTLQFFFLKEGASLHVFLFQLLFFSLWKRYGLHTLKAGNSYFHFFKRNNFVVAVSYSSWYNSKKKKKKEKKALSHCINLDGCLRNSFFGWLSLHLGT